jgi:hypothetical protein
MKLQQNQLDNKVTCRSALDPRGGLWPVLLKGNPLGRPVPQQWGH